MSHTSLITPIKNLSETWTKYQETGNIDIPVFANEFVEIINTNSSDSFILNPSFPLFMEILRQVSEQEMISQKIYRTLSLEKANRFLNQLCQNISKHEQISSVLVQQWVGDILFLFKNYVWLNKINRAGRVENWFSIFLSLLKAGNINVGSFLRIWKRYYHDNIAFQYRLRERIVHLSWREMWIRILCIGNWLHRYYANTSYKSHVAILSENRIEMVLVDLACLSFGIVDVMVPINSTPDDMEYIINNSEASILLVSNQTLLNSLLPRLSRLRNLQKIIIFDSPTGTSREGIISYHELMSQATPPDEKELDNIFQKIKVTDLATIMYTSGTTGKPKGIMFSHLNIVSKRFARALLWPTLSEKDIFLCYLPLYHTFGRWLEMMGSLYWGTRYIFCQSPNIKNLLLEMRKYHPSIFISIPQKWQQIYETVAAEIDLDYATDEQIYSILHHLTGGNLRLGLSAAGYLDPDIFRFYQRNGVELMSGFGMTEATGGITMTPPGGYKENSLGKALPGIQLKLDEDGELKIKGPYVMMGYWKTSPEENPFDKKGWLPTGDIMQIDRDNYIYIIDRKKEIYKNIKGQTIAPQRIENYFRDIDAVVRVFLVGDKREYNTMLIYPNYQYSELNLREMSSTELHDFMGSLVVSVNQFLAPYERIVNFHIIERDFDYNKGELTSKNSYRRKVIEKNFKNVIDQMYLTHQVRLQFGQFQILFPNWLLRELGILAKEVNLNTSNNLTIQGTSILDLETDPEDPHRIRIGNLWYRVKKKQIDLGILLSSPLLWLTNQQLVELTEEKVFNWSRMEKEDAEISIDFNIKPNSQSFYLVWQTFQTIKQYQFYNLRGLHYAGLVLQFGDPVQAMMSVEHFQKVEQNASSELGFFCNQLLLWGVVNSHARVKRETFLRLQPVVNEEKWLDVFKLFLNSDANFLDETTRHQLSQQGIGDTKLGQLMVYIKSIADQLSEKQKPCIPVSFTTLIRFLQHYASLHPINFKGIRQLITELGIKAVNHDIKEMAQNVIDQTQQAFRNWLGPNSPIAVDPEMGKEYSWKQVIVFDDNVTENHQQILVNLISQTPFIREALFLFTNYLVVDLKDLPLNGIWVTLIGEQHGKSVYRISVQTRYQGRYDIAANLNQFLSEEQVKDEISWLIVSGERPNLPKLVEDFGGYWVEYQTWSEEYIPGETVNTYLQRIFRKKSNYDQQRLKELWPYIIWSSCKAYVDFWNRTGRKYEIADPSPSNIIVPHHDYQTGSRIISISSRKSHQSLWDFLLNFNTYFIEEIEKNYPFLQEGNTWQFVFSPILEILGEKEGIQYLERKINSSILSPTKEVLGREVSSYLKGIKKRGFTAKQLYFAIQRYKRWKTLNSSATIKAEISTLYELYRTYNLQNLESKYPETRIRFYRETVLHESKREIVDQLDQLISLIRNQQLSSDDIQQYIHNIQRSIKLNSREKYFITRMGYIHLQPTDAAELLTWETGEKAQAALVVIFHDREGEQIRMRNPLNPKEVARLHRLFHQSNLPVSFQSQDQFLLAFNERDQLVGGLFFHQHDPDTVHLEKIVIADHYRRKWVSSRLLDEFFKRLKSSGFKRVKTGFFRPEFFYRFGFRIEKGYAGLVKTLSD